MIRLNIIWLIALTGLLNGCRSSRNALNSDNSFFRYQPGMPAAISAHRGGGDYEGYPENCIESFAWLANQMPVTIECDIVMTKDSVLIMMHDNTFDRTTTGRGKGDGFLFCL